MHSEIYHELRDIVDKKYGNEDIDLEDYKLMNYALIDCLAEYESAIDDDDGEGEPIIEEAPKLRAVGGIR